MRRPSSYLIFAAWFAIIGPFVVMPVPVLLFGAHLLGAIPGLLAGASLAYRFRDVAAPTAAVRRALAGLQVGSTVSCFCCAIGATVYWYAGWGGSHFRMWLEDALLFGIGFSLIGGVAGAFAFVLMPAGLRNFGSAAGSTSTPTPDL
ncbi:MAG: hypothetical protein V4505_05305 [Pseudomonadota bacterium]